MLIILHLSIDLFPYFLFLLSWEVLSYINMYNLIIEWYQSLSCVYCWASRIVHASSSLGPTVRGCWKFRLHCGPPPSCQIAALGLPSLQLPTPSLCCVWRGVFSPILPRDMAWYLVVFIKLGLPSPKKPVLEGWVRPNPNSKTKFRPLQADINLCQRCLAIITTVRANYY